MVSIESNYSPRLVHIERGIGDVVPVVGFVYRVISTDSVGVRFQWIPDKELPQGLQPIQSDSLILPAILKEGVGQLSLFPDE